MRYTFVIGLYALVNTASAQNQCVGVASAIPQCAQSCFAEAMPQVGCAIDDYKCQCDPVVQSSINQLALPCVATACPAIQFAPVAAAAQAVCACAATATDLSFPAVITPAAAAHRIDGQNPLAARQAPVTELPDGQPNAPYTPTTGGSMGGSMTSSAAAQGSMTGNAGMVGSMVGSMITSATAAACTPGPQTKDCGAVAGTIPGCALLCFAGALGSLGISVTDYTAQCAAAAQSQISSAVIPCVATACPTASFAAVAQSASAVCSCASAPATTTITCPAGATATSAAAATTSTAKTVATGAASTPSTSLLTIFACIGVSVLSSALLL